MILFDVQGCEIEESSAEQVPGPPVGLPAGRLAAGLPPCLVLGRMAAWPLGRLDAWAAWLPICLAA